jgi:hypothetical protein
MLLFVIDLIRTVFKLKRRNWSKNLEKFLKNWRQIIRKDCRSLSFQFDGDLAHLVRADAELELVVAARLDDDGVARVELGHVQMVGILFVLQERGPMLKMTIFDYFSQDLCY